MDFQRQGGHRARRGGRGHPNGCRMDSTFARQTQDLEHALFESPLATRAAWPAQQIWRLYQKGRFIVEICTLRAVDIDVRRSPVVVDGNHGHEVQLIGSTVRGQLHCLDPSSSCPPSPGAAVDTPSGWAAARGAGRLCPAAPRSSLMHCPCLRRGRRQRGSNAAYPGGVPWSGRGCHQPGGGFHIGPSWEHRGVHVRWRRRCCSRRARPPGGSLCEGRRGQRPRG